MTGNSTMYPTLPIYLLTTENTVSTYMYI